MINGQNFFDELVKNDMGTYENIRNITTSQENDYTTGCFLYDSFFKKHYKIIAIVFSKQLILIQK